ncbi:ABC transporter ATP-binding protein [Salinispira pacifica]|uniref:Oligopeptide transport ATP-binding protein OppD n=1 Tax=Salinispira pacifica TaxID=1307761 RepID=V5WJL1_9SPIO|nr:ABC transporter ATP-binding protein [Salinispira pacifica]AHC15830.1 Oligopeptide transport ATP-binding protein OppD [Salinispira pacifica]
MSNTARNRYSDLEIHGLEMSAHHPSGEIPVLHDITLNIPSAQVTAIVGESGSGKTMSMRGISGLLPGGGNFTVRGDVLYNGRHLAPGTNGADSETSPKFAMIFQDPKKVLNPGLRVGQHLTEVLRYASGFTGRDSRLQRIERAQEILGRVDLPTDRRFFRSFPHELSGGMQQRLVIACVVAGENDVLIADEAITALDSRTAARILDLFHDIAGNMGKTVVYISHDLKTVERIASHVAVLYAGYTVEYRNSRDFFSMPRHPYSRMLMESHPALRDRGRPLRIIPGEAVSPADPPPGCPFHPRCPRAQQTCREVLPQLIPDTGGAVRCHFPYPEKGNGEKDSTRKNSGAPGAGEQFNE